MSTDEYRERLGHWGYWKWGLADQPRAAAVNYAAAELRVSTPTGAGTIPDAVLELGLVYLRATVSGSMGPMSDEYEQLRDEHGHPSVEDDCRVQVDEMVAAMTSVVSWAYDR